MSYSQTKLEGLVIQKAIHGERNLIAKILLRSGRVVSLFFPGGRGGGKKHKSSIVELGYMLNIEIAQTASGKELYHAKEWQLIWSHQKIRDQHRAFYLLHFICELLGRLTVEEDLHHPYSGLEEEQAGLFRVASNTLFYMDDFLIKNKFQSIDFACLFLAKLLIEQGLYPEVNICVFTEKNLNILQEMVLEPEQGGFVSASAINHPVDLGENYRLWMFLKDAAAVQTKDFDFAKYQLNKISFKILFHYFCFHQHMNSESFKSIHMAL